MNSKKTTFLLSLILIIILILLFLRPCGILNKIQQRFQKPVAIEQTEEVIPDTSTANKFAVNKGVCETTNFSGKNFNHAKHHRALVFKPSAAVTTNNESSIPSDLATAMAVKAVNLWDFSKPFYVYSDVGSKNNHYYLSGFMGNVKALIANKFWENNPESGKTCIKVTYNTQVEGEGWAGIYWQQPANNWGDKGAGYNLTGAAKLTFWARGEKGGEEIGTFMVGGIQGKISEDSDSRTLGPVDLTKDWKQYTIYLTGMDLSNIIGGFGFTVTQDSNPNGAVFYLDDIRFE